MSGTWIIDPDDNSLPIDEHWVNQHQVRPINIQVVTVMAVDDTDDDRPLEAIPHVTLVIEWARSEAETAGDPDAPPTAAISIVLPPAIAMRVSTALGSAAVQAQMDLKAILKLREES